MGDYHCLGIKADGTLWTWGQNSFGQLGIGNTISQSSPVQVGVGTNWVKIAAGSGHSIAIKSDGTLWTFGRNNFGQIGDGSQTTRTSPVKIGTATWVAIAGGQYHTLAIKTDGTLWAWGSNDNGQLGDGTSSTRKSPVKIGTAANWNSVSAGESHSHALKSNGTLWAWGRNSNGELGDGTSNNVSSPSQIGAYTDWVSIKSGFQFSTGIRSSANIFCSTGDNSMGQLGHGTNISSTTYDCDSITFQCVLSTLPITPVCGDLTADLTAGISSEVGAYTFSFYTDSALTSPAVNPVSVAGMYYVKATTAYGCDLRDSILVNTFSANPSAPSGSNGTACGNLISISLSATAGAGETVDWYSEPTEGLLLLSGSTSFSTPNISATKTYYAEARNSSSGCISSSRTAVTAFVNVLTTTPTISSYVSSGISSPKYIAFDAAGNLYLSSTSANSIEKVDLAGVVSTFVNTGLSSPAGLAFDASGNLYVANTGNNTIKKITSGGSVSTFVSTGLSSPAGLAFDTTGNLYVANTGSNTIKKVTSGGSISTFVSSGLTSPSGLAFDIEGNLYAANTTVGTISKINKFGTVTTFVSAGLSSPIGLAIDATGNLYTANSGINTMSKIDPLGVVSVFVNTGMSSPNGISIDGDGNLFIANNGDQTISKITLAPPTISSFAPVNRPSGDTVTIYGRNFQGTSAVSFGATAAASFSVVNDTTIKAVVGSGASGKVIVTNAACSDSLAGFTYCVRPSSPLSADTTICHGLTANLSATGVGTLGWYTLASGGTYLGGGSTLHTSALSSTTIFYVQDSTCAASASRTAVTVTVSPLSVAGSILGATTVCSGTNSTPLTLSGSTGSIQWQSS